MSFGIIYGFRTLEPTTLASVELGYVGKTRQGLRIRELQHRDKQPWSDIIVGSAYVIRSGDWTDAEMEEVEAWAIKILNPRYNGTGNGLNAGRTSSAEALEQRLARDRARGIPLWRPSSPMPAIQPKVVGPKRAARAERAAKRWSNRTGRAMTASHTRVLELIRSGVCSPRDLAVAMDYSERQVHNLLNELRDSYRVIRRARHGQYVLAEEAP